MGHKYALKYEQNIAIHAYRSQNITRRNLEINNYNFNCKRKKFSHNTHATTNLAFALDKWQKTTNRKKSPHGMYNHINTCILLVIVRIFHPFTNRRAIGQHFKIKLTLNDLI